MANIEKRQTGFVSQALSIDEMLEQWRTYEELKVKLRGDKDFIPFRTKDGKIRETPTKYWRVKLERFFRASVEIVSKEEKDLGNGEV